MMKSMPFWTICLDLEVSELLKNFTWKELSRNGIKRIKGGAGDIAQWHKCLPVKA